MKTPINTISAKKLATIGCAGLLGLTTLIGCGSSDDAASTTAAASADAGAESAPASGGPLDANSASEDEMKAAFEAAGLPNAETWAHEIVEYRPFDTMEEMHEELKEYDISDDTWTQLSELVTLGG